MTTFIGRHEEREAVEALLAQHRLVTLVGSGGSGKTRLAIEVARTAACPDGVWWIDLARLADGSLVPNAIAAALAIKEVAGAALTTTIAETLGDARALLLVDNCEHVIASCAATLDALLASCPHLVVLATSREALGDRCDQKDVIRDLRHV